jgi:hypothetical protein
VPGNNDGSVLSSTAYIAFSHWITGFGNWAQNIEGSCVQKCGC